MPAIAHQELFAITGDFAATRAAEDWCKAHGISVGTMQRGAPRGLLVGDFDISKWRNMNRREIAALHGQLIGDGRNGPVRVQLFDNCPPIPGVIE